MYVVLKTFLALGNMTPAFLLERKCLFLCSIEIQGFLLVEVQGLGAGTRSVSLKSTEPAKIPALLHDYLYRNEANDVLLTVSVYC